MKLIKITLPFVTLLVLLVLPLKGEDKKPQNITLTEIEGRTWLLDTSGKPFFAHGITHVNNNRAKIEFAKISDACKEIGFNAYGYGCPPELRKDMPYIESWNHLVPISTYRGDGSLKFVDVFDLKEQSRLEKGVKSYCFKSRNNPNLIGYCWTDLGAWPLKNSTKKNWVEFIRSLPEDAPGQKTYKKFISTWEGDDDTARDQEFLRLIAREYFRVIGEANRKYDPDHLIFGDRFAFNTLDNDVLKEMLPWVDGIAIQPPFRGSFPKKIFDDIHKLTGKPVLLCDFAIRFNDGDKDIRSFKPAADSVAAGRSYYEYVKAAINTDYIIGVFWCNPVDTSRGFGKPGVKQGFFGEGLTERPGLHQAVKKLNAYRDEKTPERGSFGK
ncbi:MAG: beta-agarase [Blastopirellula sp.]|nr:MAG: beta-agarase [Blastopirellula sp.]